MDFDYPLSNNNKLQFTVKIEQHKNIVIICIQMFITNIINGKTETVFCYQVVKHSVLAKSNFRKASLQLRFFAGILTAFGLY